MRSLLQTALCRRLWNTNFKQTAAQAYHGGDSTCNSLVSIAVGWTDIYRSVNSKHLVYFKWHGTLIQERDRLPTSLAEKQLNKPDKEVAILFMNWTTYTYVSLL